MMANEGSLILSGTVITQNLLMAGTDLIDLDDFTIDVSTVPLQHPAALYHNPAAVSPGVHEFSLPVSFLGELAFDLG